jgi:hypothetical protein
MITVSTIFFRILNAAIIFGLIGYCFKKYVLAGARRDLEQKDATRQNQELTKEMLKEQKEEIEKTLAAHEQFGVRLSNNIQLWAHAVEEQKKELANTHNMIRRRIMQRSQEELQHKEEKLITQDVIKPAIAQAREELQRQFSDPAIANRYMQDLISRLEKKKI